MFNGVRGARVLWSLALAIPATVFAQPYPAKPIRFVVGYAPGGGHVMSTFNALPALLPHIKQQKTRAVAVSTEKRVKVLPQVPTIGETLPGYVVSTWYGNAVRAGTPEDIVAALGEATLKVIAMPEVQNALGRVGAEIVGTGSKQSAAFIRAEIAKYAKVAKAADIRVE